ncbi:hypothetical protein TRVL_07478 [Trypanosoma vivax]|nr:hypothetical protein TRVL_07478 [Trypanosoma vivax]
MVEWVLARAGMHKAVETQSRSKATAMAAENGMEKKDAAFEPLSGLEKGAGKATTKLEQAGQKALYATMLTVRKDASVKEVVTLTASITKQNTGSKACLKTGKSSEVPTHSTEP